MINPINEISFFENEWIDVDDVIDESDFDDPNEELNDEDNEFDFYKKYEIRFAR